VYELEANLVTLGYATDAELKATASTTLRRRRGQEVAEARAADQTGTFQRADVVLATAAIRVAKRTAEPGSNLGPSASVLDYTGTRDSSR